MTLPVTASAGGRHWSGSPCGAQSGRATAGEPVELEAMSAVERKVVHVRLKEFDGVETSSEGTEPNRYVVISPT